MNQFSSKPKGDASPMEDTYVVTPAYIAVFDGATPKTAFRFPDGRTPGQVAAQALAQATATMQSDLDAYTAITYLTSALADALEGHQGEASGVIYSLYRREIWSIGDCQFGILHRDGTWFSHHSEKSIDAHLSHWRASIIKSYLSRGLMTSSEIQANDPGRHIIQPFISRQVLYQNQPSSLVTSHTSLHFGVFDGTPIPSRFIEIHPIPSDVQAVVLASDGYPELFPTLEESEARLAHLLTLDPLCIGPLCGTKGILPGNDSYDDRTYLRIEELSPRNKRQEHQNCNM